MAVKYQIQFMDKDGNACKVSFDFAGWSGPYRDIVAVDGAVTISYQGSPDDLFQQIVTSQAIIRCIADADFVKDTRDIDDKEVFVTIETPATIWIGYLITFQRAESFDSGGYELEMIAKDPFSYLKENSYQILSNKYVMGLQNMNAICTNIIGESISSSDVDFVSTYKPIDSDGNVVTLPNTFSRIFMRLETFMNNGLLPSGYDIISKICDLFNSTAFVCDGKLYIRQPKALLGLPVKPIREMSKGGDFVIDDEQLTRTKAYAQIGVKHAYGEIGGNIVPNNFFYYVDQSAAAGSEIMHWQYMTGINPVYRSKIIREDGKGIFIKGLYDGVETYWPGNLFMFSLSDFNTNIVQPDSTLNDEYILRIKYRYHRYVLTRTTAPIKYAMRVFAVFGDGSMVSYRYDGDGGRDKSGTWQERPDSGDPSPSLLSLISFPLEATGNESTFELKLICKGGNNFPTGKGDYQFMTVLYPISSGTTNGSIPDAVIPDTINITECSIEPDIYSMPDFEINRDINPARNRTESALFVSDNTNIRSERNYKEVADTVEVAAGVKTSEVPDAVVNNPIQYQLSNLNGSLQLSPTIPIVKFDSMGTRDKLVTLNAMDRMYFLRQPRNQITVDVRSSTLKFSDILSFPDFIDGKYVQMESEYRVQECEHTITVQELKGSEDSNDIIENYLSTE